MTNKLRPFRHVPRDAREWARWMEEQDLTPDGVTSYDSLTVGNLTVTDSFEIQDTYYDDLKFPAASANPPGLASDPDFDTTNGGYLFDAGSTELLFFAAQMPHAWKEGTGIHPHLHWQKTTSASGNVYWQLDYKMAPIGEVMDSSFTTLTTTSVVGSTPDTDTANKHLISSFDEISMTGKGLSDMILIKLSRIGGSDTYGADARLLEFDIHYEINSFGSAQEFRQ